MTIPTAQDWANDPAKAAADAAAQAQTTAADGAASTAAIVLGIAGQILTAAAPIAGLAIGGPWGPIIQAALASLSSQMGSQSMSVLSSLTPAQQQIVQSTIQVAVQEAMAAIQKAKT